MKSGYQTTLRKRITLSGSGVHKNLPARITLNPAEANFGLVFLRSNLQGGGRRYIKACSSQVTTTDLCTVIGHNSDASVSTIEHVLAALVGLGVDNALIEVDGPEVPIMDGSAAPFVEAIDEAGIVSLEEPRRILKVLKPVRIEHGKGYAELLPNPRGFRLEIEIDFDTALIGRQKKSIDLDASRFRKEIARARTFGFMRDVQYLWDRGAALGASLDNTVALSDDRILNPEGLRYPDEFVRHKMLDAIGDLALAGASIAGTYRSCRGGHKMNVAILQALFADTSNYAFIDAVPRREGFRPEAVSALSPAFAPDLS